MIDWEQNERFAAEIAKATSPHEMMMIERLAQHFATKATNGEYNGGSWGLHKCQIEEVGAGYYLLLESDKDDFTVNCAGMMTTVTMNAKTLSYAVSLHAANYLNMQAFQTGDTKSNEFWHNCYFAVYQKAREELDEFELGNLAMYLD